MLKLVILISALTHLTAIIFEWQLIFYITKPLTMVLIIALCALAFRGPHNNRYVKLFITGLIFSLIGDSILMFRIPELFIPGLLAFLTAHIFYIIALWTDLKIYKIDIISGTIIIIAGSGLFYYLHPFLDPGMKIPVFFYLLVISLMVWRAAGVYARGALQPRQQHLVAAGAILFYASDLILGINRFAHPIPHALLILMAAYFTAQYLLALSAYRKA